MAIGSEVKLSSKEKAYVDAVDAGGDKVQIVHIDLRGSKNQEHGHTVLDKDGVSNLMQVLQDVYKRM